MTGSSGYDAARVRCPAHRTPVIYKPGERFDPLGDVACQEPTCTALEDQERAVSELLSTGRTTLGGIVDIQYGRLCPSCGRHLDAWPSFGQEPGEPVCELMSGHACGYPVAGDRTCSRPFGHSAYSGGGHRAEVAP